MTHDKANDCDTFITDMNMTQDTTFISQNVTQGHAFFYPRPMLSSCGGGGCIGCKVSPTHQTFWRRYLTAHTPPIPIKQTVLIGYMPHNTELTIVSFD